MAVTKRLRYEVLRRDNYSCRYCGRSAPEVKLTVDHVVPVALGGSDEPSNLVAACADCNSGKSSVPADAPLVDDVAADAMRWSRAMQQVSDMRIMQIQYDNDILEWFSGLWEGWTYGPDKLPVPAPDGFDSVLTFLANGMSPEEIDNLVRVAMNANHIRPEATWKYFCGCCWKRIRENVEIAGQLIAAEGDA
ncbi:HNH endonuclease, putative [Mycobacteroides abscessus subsp. massiliense]|nr:HNH endonuclease, putative [Mycobacteroides abscessus subsp. massiliense]SKY71666.1 HNH endonuclease, putative [Mycobacteroides abscessus subsp. massiliense]